MTALRHDWSTKDVLQLFTQPFFELVTQAHHIHRSHFPKTDIQLSMLLSIKTGACPEDCKYCPQSAHYKTTVEKESLLSLEKVKEAALAAKEKGATRFCMGAAWRSPTARQMGEVVAMVKEVKALGLESCATLGMLNASQAQELKDAGLDYYNHNLDTSPDFYSEIITTRSYDDRLDTLEEVRKAGIKVCCGGILGMGETREDRANLLIALANQMPHPESVPVNKLIAIPGTPLENGKEIDSFEFVRTIAVARIMMPHSVIRLSAGRENMDEGVQAWCFFAGANSIFYGDTLLTAKNPTENKDLELLKKLDLQPLKHEEVVCEHESNVL